MATAKAGKPEINVLCLVSYNFLPAKMGGQKCIDVLLAYMAKYVNLICVTTKSNNAVEARYRVLNILSNSPLRYISIFYFFTLRKLIKQYRISHLQIEHPYYGWLALLLKKACGVKLIVHSHNIEGERFKSMGKWWAELLLKYERFIHQKADYLFYITEEDRAYAVKNFKVQFTKTLLVPYGIELDKQPSFEEKQAAKNWLQTKYAIPPGESILLLNGAFGYKPNLDALLFVVGELNPALLMLHNFKYKILVCGKDIPESIAHTLHQNIVFAGFVDDITMYLKGADIFLNPIISGGGIKTKLVEALAYGLSVVSFKEGAIGIPKLLTGDKLAILEDKSGGSAFALNVQYVAGIFSPIPDEYFTFFNAGVIGNSAAAFISDGI